MLWSEGSVALAVAHSTNLLSPNQSFRLIFNSFHCLDTTMDVLKSVTAAGSAAVITVTGM